MNLLETDIRLLYEYMQLNMPTVQADVIIGMGSSDIRTAQHAAALYLKGLAPKLVFTGGRGKMTVDQEQTEAEKFRDVAVAAGVPVEAIMLEAKSSNTGQNVQYLYELLQPYTVSKLLVACKPYNERRVLATFKKQWPDANTGIIVSSMPIACEEYPNEVISKDDFINLMVGDVWRIKSYAEAGFQTPQNIPDEVWAAMQRLISQGYNKYIS